MLVAETHRGHREDPALRAELADADPHRVVLSDTERQRSRVRTETTEGADLGIVVGQDLRDGDVLATEDGALVVVELAAVEAVRLEVGEAGVSPTAALELGHALGNRHWDLAVEDGAALVPVADTRDRTAATLEDLLPDGVARTFVTVPPTTFDDGGVPDHHHGGEGHGVRTIEGGEDG